MFTVHNCALTLLVHATGTGLRSFTFDSVFGEKSEQSEVYLTSVQRLVVSFLNGRNACVIAYGQTGATPLEVKISSHW